MCASCHAASADPGNPPFFWLPCGSFLTIFLLLISWLLLLNFRCWLLPSFYLTSGSWKAFQLWSALLLSSLPTEGNPTSSKSTNRSHLLMIQQQPRLLSWDLVTWYLHVVQWCPSDEDKLNLHPLTHLPHTVLLDPSFHDNINDHFIINIKSHLILSFTHIQQVHHQGLCTLASEGLLRSFIFSFIATVPITWFLTYTSATDPAVLILDPVICQNIPHTKGIVLS